MTQCKNGPAFPAWIQSSASYRKLFNETAKELGLAITYLSDDPQGLANAPELKWGEVSVDAAEWKKYDVTELRPRSSKLLDQDICTVRAEVERRRKAVNDAGMQVFPLEKSSTFSQRRDALLNPAEKAWYQRVGETLYDASMVIYGIQAAPQHPETLKWVHRQADPSSRFHYERARAASGAPKKDVPGIPESNRYASSVSWFPDAPSYSNMWPLDLTADELTYINATYNDQDPIRLPWTRVSRVSAADAEKIADNSPKFDEPQHEWARKGAGDRWYRVVNMTADPEMRPQFLRMAKALRDNAGISVKGSTLDPQFKQLTLTMADCLESGDFQRLLVEDLKQASGNLFMTFFPHEGYWRDGVKYPIIFEVGVVDTTALDRLKAQSYVFNWLGKEVEKLAQGAGFSKYTAPVFNADNVRRTAAFLWPLRTGGFMRAFQRDPGGHDYPKRSYPGISDHRVVMLLDTLTSWNAMLNNLMGKLLPEGNRPSAPRIIDFAVYHEAGHGAQIPQNQILPNGKTLNGALGKWWGVLVEPWADVGAVLAYDKLKDDGVIQEAEFRDVVLSGLIYNVLRLYPRQVALSDDMIAEGPHITGSSMYLGWLYREGAIRWQDNRLTVDMKKISLSSRTFFDALVRQAVAGDPEAFKTFANDCVAALPEDVEKQLIANKKSTASYVLIDRGEFGKK